MPDGAPNASYAIDIQPLPGRVAISRAGTVLASSTRALVMYETRLPPTVYFPPEDVVAELGGPGELQTFCPFKGTASYRDLLVDGERIDDGVWIYADALPESDAIRGFVGFMPHAYTDLDLGANRLRDAGEGNIGGPLIDWLMREAAGLDTPEAFTAALSEKLCQQGIALSRLSVMIWSLHPMIVGKNYTWTRGEDEITTLAPSYEIHSHPAFLNSPLRHVANGKGGVRQKIGTDYRDNSFPIIEDLRASGATDYVAMPLTFSDGRRHVLTLTSDRAGGFSTADLGLVFECASVIGRFYEVFMQRENAQVLLETYVGKRTGARVLGGDIRRGDGDDIDAAIMFCDLRDSTALEERLGRVEYIALLNAFFEVVSTVVQQNGGEVLKFIGDAVLAVFAAGDDPEEAKAQALNSARAIVARVMAGDGCAHSCDCAIGIAYGRVTYGNVGSRERLDFTVIGQAANIAARLGDYGKTHGHRIVTADDTVGSKAQAASMGAIPLGAVALHNVSRPVRCYAVPASAAAFEPKCRTEPGARIT